MSKLTDTVTNWVRPEIRALSAYHVPDSANFIKLDAMENPYNWPEPMVDGWLAMLRDVELNRYPDPSPANLKKSLGQAMGVPAGMDVLLGNGSDELIQMIAMAMALPGRKILAPEPSFVMYKMIATFTGMDYVGVPLSSNETEMFSLDLPAMLAAVEEHQPAIVFLAYPNNPTGNLFDRDAVKAIIEASPGLVVVDEAYHAFAGDSFMAELGAYENLVVMRTVSKMGLAGLRLGLLAGPKAWLAEFDKVRLPYNINVLTQKSAEFALEHREVLDQQTHQICVDREKLMLALDAIKGVKTFSSRANFILFRVNKEGETGSRGNNVSNALKVFESLKAQGVLIKNLSTIGGTLQDCLRVTVGSPEQNKAFLAALENCLN